MPSRRQGRGRLKRSSARRPRQVPRFFGPVGRAGLAVLLLLGHGGSVLVDGAEPSAMASLFAEAKCEKSDTVVKHQEMHCGQVCESFKCLVELLVFFTKEM